MAAPAWYKGRGVYLATDFDEPLLEQPELIGGGAARLIPENRMFITLDMETICIRFSNKTHLPIGAVIDAEKIEIGSYYDFITDSGSRFKGTPTWLSFIPLAMHKWFYLGYRFHAFPPPDITPEDALKIATMRQWIRARLQKLHLQIGYANPPLEGECRRAVESATAPNTLKNKVWRSLYENRDKYDLVAVRKALPPMLHRHFDEHVDTDRVHHLHVAR